MINHQMTVLPFTLKMHRI